MNKKRLQLLVGDNAFHGISHLSQEKARERAKKDNPVNLEFATQLVKDSLKNGANGFMFSVSETTLSILKSLDHDKKPDLYAIVPYAYEYVRLATKVGGISGLAKQFSRQIICSRNIFQVVPHFIDLLKIDLSAFLKSYLIYELSRIKASAGKNANLKSVLLHEVITDMALALDLDCLFKSYIKFFSKSSIQPGFETRNFPYLIQKFKAWGIDMKKLTLTASFNKAGFQMNPSKVECENALRESSGAQVIAMSVLAAGYFQPHEAIDYIKGLTGLSGLVVGVSSYRQAIETFKIFQNVLHS